MRYKAFIMVPKADDDAFELTKGTNDELDAFHWLAVQVADHPAAELYGIEDRKLGVMIHQAGVVEPELRAEIQRRIATI